MYFYNITIIKTYKLLCCVVSRFVLFVTKKKKLHVITVY